MMMFFPRKLINLALMTSTLLFALSGIEVMISQCFKSDFFRVRAIAQAQEFTQQQLERYAQALLQIEPLRQKTFQEIQRVLESQEVPNIACNRPNSYENLPSSARSAIVDYCNQSKEIVEEQGLTVSEFNNITAKVQSNPELKEQVQEAMLELQ